ncbi:MAG: sterol desaturase family protein [Bacteroidota bacterium]
MILGLYMYIYENLSFVQFEFSNVWVAIIGFIVFDFLFYWSHRWGHEWNVMWGAHIVHHQSKEFNLSVALRQSWFHNLLMFWFFFPMVLFGLHPMMLVLIVAVSTLAQYWIHTKFIGKLSKWIELIFNTPSHHRVHHATNKHYLDKNYGAVFIIWDRIFGTFEEEQEEVVFGITAPYESNDATWANVHFYTEMWEGMKRERSLKDKIALLFKGPDYLGALVPELYEKKEVIESVKPKMKWTNYYVLMQFILLNLGMIFYMQSFDQLHISYQWFFVGLIVLTTFTLGALLSNSNNVWHWEIIRLVVAGAVISYLYYTQFSFWFYFVVGISFVVIAVSNVLYFGYVRRQFLQVN